MKKFVVIALIAAGCATKVAVTKLYAPTVIKLPEGCSNPDGMALGRDGCIYLSINNCGEGMKFKNPARIVRITSRDKIENVCELPKHPETGVVSPLGLCFGSDGNLYVADNQMFATSKWGMSRLLRVNFERGKAKGVEVVALGMNIANGLTARGDSIYLTETKLDDETPMTSGIYRFKLAELNPGNPVRVTGKGDPHLIFTLKTHNKQMRIGANGVDFDSKGNLYVCNFADVEVWKLACDAEGKVVSSAVFAKGGGLESVDGMHYDGHGNFWIADIVGNAIARLSTRTGQIAVIAKNAVNDGAYGELDTPSECIRRGDKIYISNIDLTLSVHKADDVRTLSVIDLKQ